MDNKKDYFPLISRLRRRDYVLWQLLLFIGVILFLALNYVSLNFLRHITWNDKHWLMFVFILVEIYFTARRLQDCNISGWFSLLLFFRVLIVPMILFMCINSGTKGANKFGTDPCENNKVSNKSNEDNQDASH
jgi:uncharacterized membrane protein YhaH (DUF805 family)